MLRNHIGGIAHNIAYGDSASFEVLKVAIIISGCKFADQLYILRSIQRFLIDGTFIGNNNIRILGSLDYFLPADRVAICGYFTEFVEDIDTDIGTYTVSFQYDDFHTLSYP